MIKDWRIVYEIPPMRGIYEEVVVGSTEDEAIENLKNSYDFQIRVIRADEITA